MEDVWSGWKKLKKVKPYIDKLPEAREEAEKSLRSFKHRQKHFERLIVLAAGIDIENEIKAVDSLERECTHYWYSYVERKTFWEKALGLPTRLPSAELNRFQTLLVTEINPEIDIDMVIKQSQLLGLIKKIGKALTWHRSIITLTRQLEAELLFHKDAERAVNILLGSQGEVTPILDEIRLILEDTSPDFADWGAVLVADCQSYWERAKE
jgi:hypothetical protein